jgi:hypothetical protein
MNIVFENGYAEGTVMAVPLCFRSALEKERFDRGDTFYDTRKAYEGTWAQAITHLSYGLQVTSFPGTQVEFILMRPVGDPLKLESVKKATVPVETFISYLINGYMEND